MGVQTMTDKKFSSVAALVESMSGDGPTSTALKEQLSRRRVIKGLQAMRVHKGISQRDIAVALNCTQSRISKLETGEDGDLSIADIEAYARVLECSVSLVFSKRGETAVERVKRYARYIRSELRTLAQCAHKDERIAQAVSQFFGEAFFNLVELVRSASDELPLTEDGEPYITIHAMDAADEESVVEIAAPDPQCLEHGAAP